LKKPEQIRTDGSLILKYKKKILDWTVIDGSTSNLQVVETHVARLLELRTDGSLILTDALIFVRTFGKIGNRWFSDSDLQNWEPLDL
jgi:hypothetical protein